MSVLMPEEPNTLLRADQFGMQNQSNACSGGKAGEGYDAPALSAGPHGNRSLCPGRHPRDIGSIRTRTAAGAPAPAEREFARRPTPIRYGKAGEKWQKPRPSLSARFPEVYGDGRI